MAADARNTDAGCCSKVGGNKASIAVASYARSNGRTAINIAFRPHIGSACGQTTSHGATVTRAAPNDGTAAWRRLRSCWCWGLVPGSAATGCCARPQTFGSFRIRLARLTLLRSLAAGSRIAHSRPQNTTVGGWSRKSWFQMSAKARRKNWIRGRLRLHAPREFFVSSGCPQAQSRPSVKTLGTRMKRRWPCKSGRSKTMPTALSRQRRSFRRAECAGCSIVRSAADSSSG